MNELIDIITNHGVAIGMLVYFVVRFEKILNNNTKALQDMKVTVENCKVK